VAVGGKLHRRGGKTHFSLEPEKAGAVSPSPVCLERGKLVAVVVARRRTLSKQSLQGQVSAKLTPEICINNTSSNSRLAATATDTIHRTVSRLFFFFSLSLPLMRKQPNYTSC
jgi:hypothetical protein